MIIHIPEIIKRDGVVRISSRIEYLSKNIGLPGSLWFSFPEKQEPFVSNRSDGFLLTLLVLAMHLNEGIEVRGEVSPKLAYNLDQFQAHWHAYFPKQFRRVDLSIESLKFPTFHPEAVVTAFSGGTDSLYSVWSLQNQIHPLPPENKLTHGFFLHGFDLQDYEADLYLQLVSKFESVLDPLGVSLLVARTNFRQFYSLRVNWMIAHSTPLVGAALVMGRGIKKFIKPTDGEATGGRIHRPGYAIHLLGTEETEITLHAPHKNRLDRIASMAEWEPAHELMRVCTNDNKNIDGSACYRCVKCTAVSLYLDALKIRKRFKNFPRSANFLDFIVSIMKQPGLDLYSSTWWIKMLINNGRYLFVFLYLVLFPPLVIKILGLKLGKVIIPSKLLLWFKRKVIRVNLID